MPKIPGNPNLMKTEVEPLDETIPYTGIIRKVQISDRADVNGSFYLTGGVIEINEPEEWRGRSAYFNYVPLPTEINSDMTIFERRKAEERNVEYARLCLAFKVPSDEEGVNTEDMVGCEGMFEVKNEEYQGRKIPRASKFLI